MPLRGGEFRRKKKEGGDKEKFWIKTQIYIFKDFNVFVWALLEFELQQTMNGLGFTLTKLYFLGSFLFFWMLLFLDYFPNFF